MPLLLSDFRLNQLGRFLTLAIVALGLDLIWGYGGMLSLGQGLFFGLGAYGFAMYLKLQAGGGKLPDFMFWSGLTELPWFWAPFSSPVFAMAAALVDPGAAGRHPRLLCLSQPRAGRLLLDHHPGADAADQHLVCRPAGLHRRHQRHHQLWRRQALWAGRAEQADAAGLLPGDRRGADPRLCGEPLAGGHALWPGARGDARRREPRALPGLQPRHASRSPSLCSRPPSPRWAGMLYVPQVGIISPSIMGVVPSIEIVIWVALGGRGTLIGAIVGALLVSYGRSYFSETFPDFWQSSSSACSLSPASCSSPRASSAPSRTAWHRRGARRPRQAAKTRQAQRGEFWVGRRCRRFRRRRFLMAPAANMTHRRLNPGRARADRQL